MDILKTFFPEVKLIIPRVFEDDRGYFFESFNQREFEKGIGLPIKFVQDNQSLSKQYVFRGIHYQVVKPQGKLVRVVEGAILDFVVDLRRSSATFSRCIVIHLSSGNFKQLWIPEGFGHGFFALSDKVVIAYKTTEYYDPVYDRCIIWNDPDINLVECLCKDPIVSEKDAQGKRLFESEVFL